MIRVRFEDFWPTFQPEDFFVPLLEEALEQSIEVEGSLRAEVDVRIRSVFASRAKVLTERVIRHRSRMLDRPAGSLHGAARLNLWFTGENIRPPDEGYDLTLSFDTDDYGGTNVYLPLTFVRADWFDTRGGSEGAGRTGMVIRPQSLHLSREVSTARRPKFACAFFSNPEPTRMRALAMLRALGEVDLYGPVAGRPVATKAGIAEQYRHILCFENTRFPGYVTEKPLDAWALQCVPLWAGIDRAGILNPAAIVNADDFDTLSDFVDHVADLEREPSRIDAIAASGLLRSPASLDPVVQAIRRHWARVSSSAG